MSKITLESAKALLDSGYVVVIDEKAKVVHSVNKETGETVMTYKSCYLLEDSNKKTTQIKITKAIAKSIVGNLDNVPAAFVWSSLSR